MIFSYQEFINESILTQLIMEGKIQYSPQFIQILKNTNNEIANLILSIYNQDIDSQYNYIDITDKEDSVTFIADNKIKQILGQELLIYKIENTSGRLKAVEGNKHIFDQLGLDLPDSTIRLDVGTKGKILGEIVGNSGDIYVLFESESGIKTILNKKALSLIDDREHKLWSTNRNPVKIGRLAQSILSAANKSFTASDIEKFVNSYKSSIKILNDSFSRFDIVSGDDIIEWYRSDSYYNQSGTLGNSCMANGGSILELYSLNPDQVQMVILYDENGSITNGKYSSDRILGRSILWKLDSNSDIGTHFMDRVYTNNDSDVDLFKKYADLNGWWYKSEQSYGSSFTARKKSESKSDPILYVTLDVIPEYFPYLDTICYLKRSKKLLSNNDNDWDFLLNSTGGGYESEDDY